ncbi:unnamed protein product [Kuraishia capsulata CBS 1993]|uniref:Dolichyl-phosphate-mannose--protein mannosyltransferase n=1 Tax=Kuraishia capsulata CBS 1993 TaxID=1382522 RepID=W6MY36_9ASCO|nr:uncharacterized protein KUCA_T00005944001 [Kuraishia capsulata CBS 1993]CDK29950.1 unnamed protein product [Kuraishia capsulata CBS 1993]
MAAAKLKGKKEVDSSSRGKSSKSPSGIDLDDSYLPVVKSNSTIDASDEKWYKLTSLVLTALAFATRFYSINYPNEVVFDEVHFGKFASYYIQRTYFFDLHPPFAKLLIAFVGYIVGFKGDFKFDNIGDSYIENSVPYIPLRALSAILGTLTVPIVFATMKESGYSVPTAAFAALLILFDTAHVAETRLILLDATLIISVAASILCYVRFTKQRDSPFSKLWWKWLLLTGVSLSCVISTKYVGVFTYLTIGVGVLFDLWQLLDVKKGLSMRLFFRHFIARLYSLIVLPFFIYLGWFYIHFAILTKSGPGDGFMTSEFQETLGDSPLAREARQVNYHDIITIKHKDTQCFLHSHPYQYPLRYDDGRVSSQGQQVTCHTVDDENNQWEIVPPVIPDENNKLGRPVLQGDVIRLRHLGTNGYLLAHDVASPLFPTNEEFTVIDLEQAQAGRFNDTLFRLDPYDKKKSNVLHTKSSVVKFLHVPTVVAMWTHDDELLPDWAFNQQEVNGNKKVQDNDNYWYVDQIVGLNDARSIYVPKTVKKMPFLKKWWELQGTMFEQNNKLTSEHPFASDPITWPVTLGGVSFWTKNDTREQIYFIGNIFGWWLEIALIFCYVALLLADQLSRRRAVYILNDKARARLYHNLGFLFIGWCCHYLPFFLMSRQKFLHHYLPAHLIAALFSAGLLEFIFSDNRSNDMKSDAEIKAVASSGEESSNKLAVLPYVSTLVLLVSILVTCFVFYAPLTYGNKGLSPDEIVQRQWLDIKLHFAK